MAEGDVRRVKINDVAEQKLIPALSKPKRPPTEAQIRAAQAMAEAYKIRKGILKTAPPAPPAAAEIKTVVMEESSEDDSTASQSPIRVKKEVVEDQGQVYYVPSSPEGPSFYRGKPAELTTRQCRY